MTDFLVGSSLHKAMAAAFVERACRQYGGLSLEWARVDGAIVWRVVHRGPVCVGLALCWMWWESGVKFAGGAS